MTARQIIEAEDPKVFLQMISHGLIPLRDVPIGSVFWTKARRFRYRKLSDTECEDLGDGAIMEISPNIGVLPEAMPSEYGKGN